MIYLDNAATSFPKPEPVYQALDTFARTQLANPGRAGHRMAIAAERTLDDARHALNQFFRGEGPERWIFTLNCTDGLNLAIKGTVRPGDHVITSDLEHNSISRPLRALEKAGAITLTRLASDAGLPRPRRRPPGTDAEDPAGRADARVERARDGPADRGDRADRPRGRRAVPGRRGAVGGGGPDRPAVPRRSTCSPSPATRRSTARPAPGPSTSGPRPTPRAWREGGTGGDSSSEIQPTILPYFLEGGTPNVLGVAGLAAGVAWVTERGPEALRRHEVDLLRRVVDWVERTDGWKVAGRWDPDTHVGALSLVVPDGADAPGPRLDPRHQFRHRRPPRPALRPVRPPQPRHVPRRHDPAQPRCRSTRRRTSTSS